MKTIHHSQTLPPRFFYLACYLLLLLLFAQPILLNGFRFKEPLVLRTGVFQRSDHTTGSLKQSAHQIAKLEPENGVSNDGNSDPLQAFIQSLLNGQGKEIRGVYIPGVLALPVVQQPETNPVFVSEEDGYLTQYRSAAGNGVTGLLAHNYLSGGLFDEIKNGAEVNVIYGDGGNRAYQVEKIRRFQKIEPANLSSDLIDLETGTRLTAGQVFDQVYRGGDHVTLQTCLANKGNLSWGLLFVIASPKAQ